MYLSLFASSYGKKFFISSINAYFRLRFVHSNYVEPTPKSYRSAMLKGIPDDDLPWRINFRGKIYKPSSVEDSIIYLNSSDFQKLYRGNPVWLYYRRNHKGHYPPRHPRRNCTFNGKLLTSNPCPICRDEYLVLDFRNVELLKHFVHPVSAEILEPQVTGLCNKQHKKAVLEIEKARDIGTIEMRLPLRLYNYEEYYGERLSKEALSKLAGGIAFSGRDGEQPAYEEAVRSLETLPTSLVTLLQSCAVIEHAKEVSAEPLAEDVERPRIPNRYKMEEDYKKILIRRRRAKSLILNDDL